MALIMDSPTTDRRAEQVTEAAQAIKVAKAAGDSATLAALGELYNDVGELAALDLKYRQARDVADAAARTYTERHNARRKQLDRLAVQLADAGTPVVRPGFIDSLADADLEHAAAELAALAKAAGR